MSKLLLLALAIFALFASTALALKTDSQLRAEFGQFVVQFNKKYATAEEFESRYQLYVANAQRAEQLNKESPSATFTANNQFGDWSEAEKKAFLGKIPQQRKAHVKGLAQQAPTKSLKSVDSFDLADYNVVPPVTNQGNCGSCWAFSTTEGVASAAKKAGFQDAFNLSPQVLVDCDKYDAGCNGGDLPSAFQALTELGGYMTLNDYPYTGRDGSCKFDKSKVVVPVKGFEWVIPTCERGDCEKQNAAQFLSNVADKKVAPSICVYVSDDWFYYSSGIFDRSCSSDYYDLNHCILFTGYNAEEGYVKVMNSWGETWGINGFMNIKFNEQKPNLCGWSDEATFAIVG
eukprot:UN01232